MIRTDNPLVWLVAMVIFLVGLVVYPAIKTGGFRVTSARVVALVAALGVCVYARSVALPLALLWALSLIWFPEYWGRYTGFLGGAYIDKNTPPAVVALAGWLLLIAAPALWWWFTAQWPLHP